MADIRVTWDEASARRLERSGLTEPFAGARVVDVVRAMHATHAQVMSAAEISVALRLPDATRADVRDALWSPDASLVKTFGPRGTVHLLPTADLPKWVGMFSALPKQRSQFAAGVRMTEEQTEAVLDALAVVLADGPLTLEQLDEAVVKEAGPWAGDLVMPAFQTFWPRWRQVMAPASRRGVLCFGPEQGRKVTYASPRRWLAEMPQLSPEEALTEFVTDYLRAYGPATPANFAKWLTVPERWSAGLFASLSARGDLVEVDFEGTPAWLVADDTAMPATVPSGLRLLPYFDAYVVAAQPRERLFPGRAHERATARGQAGNFPVLLIDGVVAGVWHLRRSGKKAAVTVEPLADLTKTRLRSLEEQAARIGEIVEARTELTVGPVTVGAHA